MQWRNGAELDRHLVANKDRLGEELADVLGWILLLAHDQQIDLGDAFVKKIASNKAKYPIEKAKGSAKKYTELLESPALSAGTGSAADAPCGKRSRPEGPEFAGGLWVLGN